MLLLKRSMLEGPAARQRLRFTPLRPSMDVTRFAYHNSLRWCAAPRSVADSGALIAGRLSRMISASGKPWWFLLRGQAKAVTATRPRVRLVSIRKDAVIHAEPSSKPSRVSSARVCPPGTTPSSESVASDRDRRRAGRRAKVTGTTFKSSCATNQFYVRTEGASAVAVLAAEHALSKRTDALKEDAGLGLDWRRRSPRLHVSFRYRARTPSRTPACSATANPDRRFGRAGAVWPGRGVRRAKSARFRPQRHCWARLPQLNGRAAL